MSPRRLLAALAAAALAAPAAARAQTNYSQGFSFAAGPSVPVSYLMLSVQRAGTFNFFTNSVATTADRPDPYVYLFNGTTGDLGTLIGADDDSCDDNPAFCTGSSNGFDSFLRRTLAVGTYTFAMSRYNFSEAEARSGFADVSHGFDATLHITSADGTLSAVDASGPVLHPPTVTPEPGTWALMGTGLAGMLAAARRRRLA